MKPLDIALKEYGVEEIVGSKHNPRVLEYFKVVGHEWVKDDETAWCAAFVGFCLEKCDIPSTKKLNARSYLDWGEETKKPQIGDIVVFWRISKESVYGHVGFYMGENKTNVYVLSGNQNNQVSISEYSKQRLLSYRSVPIVDTPVKELSDYTVVELATALVKKIRLKKD